MYLKKLGLPESKLTEQIPVFAGSKKDPIFLLVPGTTITKMPERIKYKIEDVDITDIKNPQVVVSRNGNFFTVTKDQLKKGFDVG
tara:strand:+ start:122 stop:376 length:255 start_codon:yes stop_codon:yes gene_type:complete